MVIASRSVFGFASEAHQTDWQNLPNEEEIRAASRPIGGTNKATGLGKQKAWTKQRAVPRTTCLGEDRGSGEVSAEGKAKCVAPPKQTTPP